MKTILVTTYAANPYKGSEDKMGWNFICQIARTNKIIAVTGANNRQAIEKYMQENQNVVYKNILFLYHDLPYYCRIFKKEKNAPSLYFLLWQRTMPAFIKKQSLNFDVVHNLNLHNDWVPSFLWKLNKPFVWGPVGHHSRIPKHLLKPYAFRYKIRERVISLIKSFFWNYSPALKKTIKMADSILCMNTSAVARLKLNESNNYAVLPSVASEDHGFISQEKKGFVVFSVGRLVPLKGFDLTIRSFAWFLKSLKPSERKDCRLVITGSGPEKELLEQIAVAEKIRDYVDFTEWVPHEKLVKLYAEASLFLFPSHESAGMVVAEALSFGLPVVCLDNNGPGEFITAACGIKIKSAGYDETVLGLASAVRKLYDEPAELNRLSNGARRRYEEQFNWDLRSAQLDTIYNKMLV